MKNIKIYRPTRDTALSIIKYYSGVSTDDELLTLLEDKNGKVYRDIASVKNIELEEIAIDYKLLITIPDVCPVTGLTTCYPQEDVELWLKNEPEHNWVTMWFDKDIEKTQAEELLYSEVDKIHNGKSRFKRFNINELSIEDRKLLEVNYDIITVISDEPILTLPGFKTALGYVIILGLTRHNRYKQRACNALFMLPNTNYGINKNDIILYKNEYVLIKDTGSVVTGMVFKTGNIVEIPLGVLKTPTFENKSITIEKLFYSKQKLFGIKNDELLEFSFDFLVGRLVQPKQIVSLKLLLISDTEYEYTVTTTGKEFIGKLDSNTVIINKTPKVAIETLSISDQAVYYKLLGKKVELKIS